MVSRYIEHFTFNLITNGRQFNPVAIFRSILVVSSQVDWSQRQALNLTLSQFNPLHTLTSSFSTIHANIILPREPGSSSFFRWGPPNKFCFQFHK
jgi:hypothetical protein